MSPPGRWAGAATTAAPATEGIDHLTRHGRSQRSVPMPWQGHTAHSGQLELSFDDQDNRRLSSPERFERFHKENLKVYEMLVALAREWIRRTGRRKVGIASLYERCRWDLAMVTNDPDHRLNNDYKAFYARLIMLREADLDGVFDLRESAEADAWIKQVTS